MFKIYEFVDLKDKKLQDNKNLKLLLFVEVHAQSVPHVPAGYNCGNTFPPLITVGNTFPLVITVGNTFLPVMTVRNRFSLVITVENTFQLLITVGKNNGLSFFLKRRGTSEMASMGYPSSIKKSCS